MFKMKSKIALVGVVSAIFAASLTCQAATKEELVAGMNNVTDRLTNEVLKDATTKDQATINDMINKLTDLKNKFNSNLNQVNSSEFDNLRNEYRHQSETKEERGLDELGFFASEKSAAVGVLFSLIVGVNAEELRKIAPEDFFGKFNFNKKIVNDIFANVLTNKKNDEEIKQFFQQAINQFENVTNTQINSISAKLDDENRKCDEKFIASLKLMLQVVEKFKTKGIKTTLNELGYADLNTVKNILLKEIEQDVVCESLNNLRDTLNEAKR